MVSSTFSFVEVVIVNFTLTGVATDTLFASPAFAVSLISLPFIFAVKYWVYLASTSQTTFSLIPQHYNLTLFISS